MITGGLLYSSKEPVECTIASGKIVGFRSVPASPERHDLFIGPGFTDLQVNGFNGIDYNEIADDASDLSQITRQLYREGVTTHLATVITNSKQTISQLIGQIVEARRQDDQTRWGIAGIHLEGPFLSAEDGPRGAHPRAFIGPPDADLFDQWQEEAGGIIRMVTVSPEWPTANSFIAHCRDRGIIVAIGHTNATPQQITDAVSAGASLSTHLGNGMHHRIARHPNYLWSQLADDRLSATIIADGFHLPDEVIQVFRKVKQDKLMLISDSVSLANMPAGDYNMHIGGKVTLTKSRRLHLQEDPNVLAGAVVSIKEGVAQLIRKQLASFQEAWDMASLRPFQTIHPGAGAFEDGAAGDVILVKQSSDFGLEVQKTFKNGVEVYSS